MTPAELERVFGRERLQIATGDHVEVVRAAASPDEERRYSKRFLATASSDLRPWTARERQILRQLGEHAGAPVARLAPPVPGEADDALHTWDAGATVDQWATQVPLRRGKAALRNVFEDCAYWWALARQCLLALDTLHGLGFVHLELKADNVCIPWTRAGADPPLPGQPLAPRFAGLALIDVAFALLPGVDLPGALPLARHPDYEYQSPRLLEAIEAGRRGDLAPTRALDWRCDFFSLAGLLWRYLPELDLTPGSAWVGERPVHAIAFVRQLLEIHSAALPEQRPHRELIALTTLRLREPQLAASFQAICTFDPERRSFAGSEPVPRTRIFKPVLLTEQDEARRLAAQAAAPAIAAPPLRKRRGGWLVAAALAAVAAVAWWLLRDPGFEWREPTLADLGLASPGVPVTQAPSVPAASPAGARASGVTTSSFDATRPPGAVASSLDLAPAPVVPALPATASPPSPLASAPERAGVTAVAGASAPSAAVNGAAPDSEPPLAGGFDAIAAELLRTRLPRLAPEAERQVARMLSVVAGSRDLRPQAELRAAIRSARSAVPPPDLKAASHDAQARALNHAARAARRRAGGLEEAIKLQMRAFGADPFDPEVVGNLAFLRLQERPPQAEAARQLALHALALKDNERPAGRIEDWTTFAIASALTGREADARAAWAVTLALASDLRRHCSAAARNPARYGERVRPSVQAMLQRAESSPGYGRCESEPERRDTARSGRSGGGRNAAARKR